MAKERVRSGAVPFSPLSLCPPRLGRAPGATNERGGDSEMAPPRPKGEPFAARLLLRPPTSNSDYNRQANSPPRLRFEVRSRVKGSSDARAGNPGGRRTASDPFRFSSPLTGPDFLGHLER